MIKKLRSEQFTSLLLLVSAILALLASNSQYQKVYSDFFSYNFPISIEFLKIHKDLSIFDWINDCLMAIFFFFVSLELKKEIIEGELSSRKKATLPIIAAIGGVIFPCIIFFIINFNHKENLRGILIPSATDIAFTYGIICFFGAKISRSIKIFVTSLAIIDDVISIAAIAFLYTKKLDASYLLLSCIAIIPLFILSRKKSENIFLYALFCALLWLMILKSGIHPSLAGIIAAAFIPFKINNKNFAEKIAHDIKPFVNFLILPLFAFANTGLTFQNLSHESFVNSLTIGIALGLFFGKQIGITLFTLLAIKLSIANLPKTKDNKSVSWLEFYGAAISTGIGFTMSLFIGRLAFEGFDQDLIDKIKIGILSGSILSALTACVIFAVVIKFKSRAKI